MLNTTPTEVTVDGLLRALEAQITQADETNMIPSSLGGWVTIIRQIRAKLGTYTEPPDPRVIAS
jgi:hypothetical protein